MSNNLQQQINVQENQINTLNNQKVDIQRSIAQNSSQIADLKNQLNLANNPLTGNGQNTAAIKQQINKLERQNQLAQDNLSSTDAQLTDIQDSYDINRSNIADPANNTGIATDQNTTTYPGEEPNVNAQTTAQAKNNTGFIAAGENSAASPNDVPQGTRTVVAADGTETTYYPDGSVSTIYPETKTEKNTLDTRIQQETAPEPIDYSNPSFVPAGTRTVIAEDGTETTYYPDGSTTTSYPGGVQTDPDLIDPNIDPNTGEFIESGKLSQYFNEDDVVGGSTNGISYQKQETQDSSTNQEQVDFIKRKDWRVRLTLAPSANYLYKTKYPGILEPLKETDGVVFPYTPSITVSYNANYDPTELIHANYRVYQYKNSSVENIQISCDFTAQDTYEANYLLAVVHFFRSATKMFYGQDNNPKSGTPPPLCFLTGLGEFQFNEHPLAITSFTYSLPTDVDYIRAGHFVGFAGENKQSYIVPDVAYSPVNTRLNGVLPGGLPVPPDFNINPRQYTTTYVPTRMQIQVSCVPMMSRNTVSRSFSLEQYATGNLLRGIQNVRGGMW